MRFLCKILVSLFLGVGLGSAAMAFVINSPQGVEFRSVTLQDLRARREVNERSLALLEGGAPLPVADSRITLLAVGDVMLSRMVAERMREKGPSYPFERMKSELRSAHITFGNLETPIAAGRPIGRREMVFRADPWAAAALADAGFDAVSLANNHMMNFGSYGLSETLRLLDGVGIEHTGAGLNAEQAHTPAVLERGGLSFAFFAYTYDARDPRGGTLPLDTGMMRADISRVRNQADYVIVSMHAGTEYVAEPNDNQVDFARAAVDAGADLVLGHHPHVVQTAERYKDGHIFYSLGNFVFDQMWSWDTRRGLGVKFTFSEEGLEQVDYLPVIVDDYAQPRPADPSESEGVVARLGNY